MQYECLKCQLDSLPKRIKKYGIDTETGHRLTNELTNEIQKLSSSASYSPEVTRNILTKLKSYSTINDPYKVEKEKSNRELMSKYGEFRKLIDSSDDKFDTALRLAIAGNIIDFGPNHKFDVFETIERVLNSDFAIDHSAQLRKAIKQADSILYLGDNCGEAVLDKLFIETINHPRVWFAVRGEPVLNDVTRSEAIGLGIDKFAQIIDNGDDCPSTILHRVSPAFLSVYKSAGLIISKGMGNFEGLMYENDPRLFYMLMIKCPVIAEKTGASTGSFVIKQNGA